MAQKVMVVAAESPEKLENEIAARLLELGTDWKVMSVSLAIGQKFSVSVRGDRPEYVASVMLYK